MGHPVYFLPKLLLCSLFSSSRTNVIPPDSPRNPVKQNYLMPAMATQLDSPQISRAQNIALKSRSPGTNSSRRYINTS